MNPLIESLWDNLVADKITKNDELERLRKKLFFELTLATGEALAWKISDLYDEAEDFAALESFRQGLCLGGRLVLAILEGDATPA